MKTEQSLELIAAWLSGNISTKGKQDFEAWLNESAANRQLAAEAEKIWHHSTFRHTLDRPDTEGQWQALQDRIAEESRYGPVRMFFKEHGIKIAASLALILVAWFIFRPAAEKQTMLASEDKVNTFYLPDSTKVWLNVHGTLSYAAGFGEEKRMVKLEGEAYFIVTPDSLRPFLVMSGNAVTEVVGTAFNVKADSMVAVTVTEGKVRLGTNDMPQNGDGTVLVKPGEKAVIGNHEDARPVKTANDNPHYAAWRMQNNPVFDEETQNPRAYLAIGRYTWKKNGINQSVIEGSLKNNATLAAFKNVVLAVTYKKPNGNIVNTQVTVYDTILPGQQIEYRKGLLDFFSKTQTLDVKIDTAEPVTNPTL